VERLNSNIGAGEGPLEQRPEILDALSVNLPTDVFVNVVHSLMNERLGSQIVIRSVAVSVDSSRALYLPQNLLLQSLALHVRNHFGADLASVAIQHPENDGLVIFTHRVL